jgi:hypothetical protein
MQHPSYGQEVTLEEPLSLRRSGAVFGGTDGEEVNEKSPPTDTPQGPAV